MIEHKLIDLFVAYSLKRNNTDIQMDIMYGLLFSHLMIISFLLFSFNIPFTWDSAVFLFTSLYLCDAIIFGFPITFSYNFSSALRLVFIGLCISCFFYIRTLLFYQVFHFILGFLKNTYSFISRIIFQNVLVISRFSI
jgi:hypothetical protein